MESASKRFRKLPPDKPIILDNCTCVYCGKEMKQGRTKEHVISRRFVPKGTLNQQWNLIVWACKTCNQRKARLEDVISAVTMQPNVLGQHVVANDLLAEESIRKGKGSISPHTRKPVSDSQNSFEVKIGFGLGAIMTANLIAPPSIDNDSIAELAYMHCMAFFYHSTYSPVERLGRFWSGIFQPVQVVTKADWGNERVLSFVDLVSTWDTKVIGLTANGFFKVVIRRNSEQSLWSFALEWNQNYRIVGFLGESTGVRKYIDKLPKLEIKWIKGLEGDRYAFHVEKSVDEEIDAMFDCQEWDQ